MAQQKGLVRDSTDAQDFNPARVGTQFCGVSLAYLEALAETIDLVQDERGVANEGTTCTEVMLQLVMPALSKKGKSTR